MKFNHYFFTVIIAINFLPLSSMPPGGPSGEGFDLVEDYINHINYDQSAKFGQELVRVYDRADDKGKKLIEQALEVYLLSVDDVRKKLAQNANANDSLVDDMRKKLVQNTTEIREYKPSEEQALRHLVAESAPDKPDDIIGLTKKEGYKTYVMYQNGSMVGFIVASKVEYGGARLIYWIFNKKAREDGEGKKLLQHAISSLVNEGATKITKTINPKEASAEQTFKLLIALGFKVAAVGVGSKGFLLEEYALSGEELKQYQQKSANENIKVQEEIPLTFDREKMPFDEGYKVEGYWASSADPLKDTYQGKFPWPKAHEKSWIGKNEFLARLNRIEKRTKIYNYKPGSLVRVQFRGLAPSRLKPEVYVGSGEYEDKKHKVKWPDGYSEHYIGKYNVIPSHEFYDYVMNYKVD